jgi:hypothetical protein
LPGYMVMGSGGMSEHPQGTVATRATAAELRADGIDAG